MSGALLFSKEAAFGRVTSKSRPAPLGMGGLAQT